MIAIQVDPTPMAAATRMAVPGLRARRMAVAAGPINSAVAKTAPTVSADRATATTRTPRKLASTSATRTPWTAASSLMTLERSSGRYRAPRQSARKPVAATTAGNVDGATANIDPNMTETAAPVVEEWVVSRYSS